MSIERPRILIIDPAQLDCRILKLLLKDTAEVTVRHNFWSAVRYLDSIDEAPAAILADAKTLSDSSLSDHLLPICQAPGQCRLIAVCHPEFPLSLRCRRELGIRAVVHKPYDLIALRTALRLGSLKRAGFRPVCERP